MTKLWQEFPLPQRVVNKIERYKELWSITHSNQFRNCRPAADKD